MKLKLAHLLFLTIVFKQCFCQNAREINWVEDVPTPGALCAIKKAHQMTDIVFTPMDSIYANPGMEYKKGEEYNGLIYSSVKEIDAFVGIDVSFHTFMTALHNQRSVLYTENVSKFPYHGVNCGAYYGVVCNTFVSYALGLKIYKSTHDLATANDMLLVEDQSSVGVRLADIIWEKGHVMLVTRIVRDSTNRKGIKLEISEAKRTGCRRTIISGKDLDKNISAGKWLLYRYRYLDKNTYVPMTDFVAVGDEVLTPFIFNDVICTNRGDKACFVQGDTVTLNISEGYGTIEIYKDSILYQKIKVEKSTDIQLADLPYGDYQARLITGRKQSNFVFWKVIDTHVSVDVKNKIVYFSSSNSIPVYVEFCNISGVRPSDGVFELTDDDLRHGYIDVTKYKMSKLQIQKGMYVKVHFECDYGRVINTPKRWNE